MTILSAKVEDFCRNLTVVVVAVAQVVSYRDPSVALCLWRHQQQALLSIAAAAVPGGADTRHRLAG